MSNFVALSREFLTNEVWLNARPKHQVIFITIVMNMAYKDTFQDHHGHKVDVKPCQLYVTIRQLAKWTSKHVSKNDVVGTLSYFERYDFLRQEVIQEKTMITIIQSDICETFSNISQTTSQTNVRQTLDIKEQDNNLKQKDDVERKKISNKEKLINEQKTVKEDIYAASIRTRKDWTSEEIEEAWGKYAKASDPVSNVFAYIEAIINNKRISKVNKLSKDKKTCTENIKAKKNSIEPSKKDKEIYLDPVTRESLLGEFMRLNGSKKK